MHILLTRPLEDSHELILKNLNYAFELGREVGEILKKESNNSYKR
jgi:hypothetical protein